MDLQGERTISIDWSDFLTGLGGVTISASEWTVPEGLVAGAATNSDTVTSLKISATAFGLYDVYNKITTSGDDKDRRARRVEIIDAALISEPSEHEARLAAVRVALDKAVAKNASEYQIANRMKREHSIADLIVLESRLIALINQARQTAALRKGHPFLQNVFTRFR
jgi:hypothetical protein